MTNLFPVTHSILSVQALIDRVLPNYELEPIIESKFFCFGLNDTFLVNTQGNRYILRVYRAGWRSPADILYELEALLHLHRQGVAVSIPLTRKDGNLIGMVEAPEGLRSIVLFTYAPGQELTYKADEENESYLYGKAVARIHSASDTFHSSHQRFILDLDRPLQASLCAIQPLLVHRPNDWEYLVTLATQLQGRIRDMPPNSLDIGFCHGDCHAGNAHLSDDKIITFFDFDSCGIGWRTYDLATFRWASRLDRKETERWQPFLRGYTEERQIDEQNIQATLYFVAIRHFWLMGLQAGNSHDWGYARMNDWYFDRGIEFLRECEVEYSRS